MNAHSERCLTRGQAPDHQPLRGRVVLAIGIGLYVSVPGGLGGTLVERVRLEQRRDPVLARYDVLLHARNARLIAIERDIAQRSGSAGIDLAPISLGTQAATAGE